MKPLCHPQQQARPPPPHSLIPHWAFLAVGSSVYCLRFRDRADRKHLKSCQVSGLVVGNLDVFLSSILSPPVFWWDFVGGTMFNIDPFCHSFTPNFFVLSCVTAASSVSSLPSCSILSPTKNSRNWRLFPHLPISVGSKNSRLSPQRPACEAVQHRILAQDRQPRHDQGILTQLLAGKGDLAIAFSLP